ncbi:Serine/Threonine-Protein Kinase 31 [Manis pentadactyla]|nr:Serine/Threonine-Protein Kinase 31 [Manis pentadactyla]
MKRAITNPGKMSCGSPPPSLRLPVSAGTPPKGRSSPEAPALKQLSIKLPPAPLHSLPFNARRDHPAAGGLLSLQCKRKLQEAEPRRKLPPFDDLLRLTREQTGRVAAASGRTATLTTADVPVWCREGLHHRVRQSLPSAF